MTTLKDKYGHSPDEIRELRQKVEAANREARDRWDDPAWHREVAAVITETIDMGFEHENLLNIMSNVSYPAYDDRETISEVRGLKAFWIARGGYIEASHMHREVLELPRDTIGFHVEDSTEKVRVNFAETQSDLVSHGIARLDAEVNLRFLRLLQAALPASPGTYVVSANGLSLVSLNSAIRQVRDASRQREVTIVGRETMTGKIVDALAGNEAYPSFIPQTNEDLLRRGVLGTYKGANIVTLINWLDEHDTAFFPANELYVIAKDASRFAFWGGMDSKEFEELDNWYWHYLAKKDFGGVIHRPERIRRFIDSSQSA